MNQALRPIAAINISTIALLTLMMLATARYGGGGGGGGSDDLNSRSDRIDRMYSGVVIEEAMERWREAPKE